jgi:hypothetical protein
MRSFRGRRYVPRTLLSIGARKHPKAESSYRCSRWRWQVRPGPTRQISHGQCARSELLPESWLRCPKFARSDPRFRSQVSYRRGKGNRANDVGMTIQYPLRLPGLRIPKSNRPIPATAHEEVTVRRKSHGIYIRCVIREGTLQPPRSDIPELDSFVSAATRQHRSVRRELETEHRTCMPFQHPRTLVRSSCCRCREPETG